MEVKKFAIQVVGLMLLIIVCLYFISSAGIVNRRGAQPSNSSSNTEQIKVGPATVTAEIADTAQERSTGLSNHDNLGTNEGMLFVFDSPGRYTFWMKEVNFPLDFIWIRNGQVVDLLTDVPIPAPGQPDSSIPKYQPREGVEVDSVLEVNAGFVSHNNIKIGDSVERAN